MSESPREPTESSDDALSHVDPAHFLRSFLVVAFHYVALFFGLLMGMMLIAWLGFPEVFQLWALQGKELEDFQHAWDSKPELLFPTGLCIWMVVLSTVLSILIGATTAYWAPFSRGGHGIFLAIISICTYLQISMTQPQIPKWMMLAMLILSPTMIVLTSNFVDRWMARRAYDEEESM